jgi:hypothetical protein
MEQEKKGFSYTVGREQIAEYRKWSIERRLQFAIQQFNGLTIKQTISQ